MRYRIIFLLFFYPFASLSQETILGDSLNKYSYTIMGINNSPKSNFGTCFFIKNNKGLFLITAGHNFYSCDSVTNKMIKKYLLAIVEVPNSPQGRLDIPIPDITDSCLRIDKDTDLVVVKIGYLWAKYINSIEDFIIPPIESLGNIEIFGQGMRTDSLYFGVAANHNIKLKPKTYRFYTNAPTDDTIYIDTVHYYIESEKVKFGSWAKGFSGSPVFLQDKGSKKWRWCGALIGGYSRIPKKQKGGIVIIKPEYILQRIANVIY